MRNTIFNINSYPGTSVISWWNGGLPLIPELTQEKTTLNNEMGNSNRVTDLADSVYSHSHHDLELSDSDFPEKCTSAQSGDDNRKVITKLHPQAKPTCSADSTGVIFPQQSTNFCQPFGCVPYSYAGPYSGGMSQSYESHVQLNSSVSGLASPRVPLPRQPSDEELIYVNPKQYHGILRRRQLRAKLEAKKKLTRGRKPYLHESRHLHAMRRVRGLGGRFVNTKQQHQMLPHTATTPRSGEISTSNTPLNSVAEVLSQNQINYFNQNSYSSHMGYNSELSGEQMHNRVSMALP